MTDANAVRRADAGDAAGIAGVIAEAFHDIPVSLWIVPDPVDRARIYPDYFRIFVDMAIPYGEVEVIDDDSGDGVAAAAVWMPVMPDPIAAPDDYDILVDKICGQYAENFRALDEVMGRHHPHEPHHYLALLAVRPGHQSDGLGSALLDYHHRKLDAAGIPAYLEASSVRSRALYLRHGFVPNHEPFVMVEGVPAEGGPAMWPLWRDPR
jgi:GNAT superfamily N-acetyltransferase